MSETKVISLSKSSQIDEQQELRIFEVLFKTWFAPLCRAVNRIVKDKDLSEDLVQDVFVKAWNNRAHLDFTQPVKSYLFKAAINTALNHLESKKKEISLDGMDTELNFPSSAAVDQQVQFNEVQKVLDKSLDLLPPKCKATFMLVKYEDMSYAEAAESLGVSVKTVENQMGKALKHMREYMQEYLGYLLTLLLILLG